MRGGEREKYLIPAHYCLCEMCHTSEPVAAAGEDDDDNGGRTKRDFIKIQLATRGRQLVFRGILR